MSGFVRFPSDLINCPVPLLSGRHALLLDFDGTLADLAPTPSRVRVASELIPVLGQLHGALGGALAVISGRPIEQIDQLLSPLNLDVAGEHGATLRWADGSLESAVVPDLDDVVAEVNSFAKAHSGLLVERKDHGVALHYRNARELGASCLELANRLSRASAGSRGELVVLRGKAVVELKATGVNKGQALRRLMQARAFRGRLPVFVGDDTTDDDAMLEAQSCGGFGIKVGVGDSPAQYRLGSPARVRRYLQTCGLMLTAGSRDAGCPD